MVLIVVIVIVLLAVMLMSRCARCMEIVIMHGLCGVSKYWRFWGWVDTVGYFPSVFLCCNWVPLVW